MTARSGRRGVRAARPPGHHLAGPRHARPRHCRLPGDHRRGGQQRFGSTTCCLIFDKVLTAARILNDLSTELSSRKRMRRPVLTIATSGDSCATTCARRSTPSSATARWCWKIWRARPAAEMLRPDRRKAAREARSLLDGSTRSWTSAARYGRSRGRGTIARLAPRR